jgi:hypothetical protein
VSDDEGKVASMVIFLKLALNVKGEGGIKIVLKPE